MNRNRVTVFLLHKASTNRFFSFLCFQPRLEPEERSKYSDWAPGLKVRCSNLGSFSSGVKRARREVIHSSPYTVEVKNKCCYTFCNTFHPQLRRSQWTCRCKTCNIAVRWGMEH